MHPVRGRPSVSQSHCVPVPLCRSPVVSQSHCVPVPLCRNPVVSLSRCVAVPLCRSPVVSQSRCVPFPLCPNSVVSQSRCVPVPVCSSLIEYWSLCVSVPEPGLEFVIRVRVTHLAWYTMGLGHNGTGTHRDGGRGLCVPVPLCPSPAVPLSHFVPVLSCPSLRVKALIHFLT